VSKSFDMSPEERSEIIGEFLSEGEAHLQVINDKLLHAEEIIKAGEKLNDEDINAMFRAAHTIKGTASFIGLNNIVTLTHEIETVLQRIRSEGMPFSAETIDVLFKAIDVLESLFEDLKISKKESTQIDAPLEMLQNLIKPKKKITKNPSKATPKESQKKSASKNSQIPEQYLEQYISETEQNIDVFDDLMLRFEKDPENRHLIDDLFRTIHTIKGSSGIVSACDIQQIAHSMESLLSLFREGIVRLDQNAAFLLFNGIDKIKELVSALKQGQDSEVNIDAVCHEFQVFLDNVKDQKAESPTPVGLLLKGNSSDLISLALSFDGKRRALDQAIQEKKNVYQITLEIEQNIDSKSMKAMLIEERLKKKGIVLVFVPGLDEIDAVKGRALIKIIYCSHIKEDDIRLVMLIDSVRFISVKHIDVKEIQRIAQKQRDVIPSQSSAMVGRPSPPSAIDTAVKPEKTALASPSVGDFLSIKDDEDAEHSPESKDKNALPIKGAPVQFSTIRIDTRKLDKLMNLSGELVTVRAQYARLIALLSAENLEQKDLFDNTGKLKNLLEELNKEVRVINDFYTQKDNGRSKKVDRILSDLNESVAILEHRLTHSNLGGRLHALDETTASLGRISSDIQAGVMQTRMVSIEGIFTRFKRVVRDISKELGKDVNLVIEGEETELDKKIVDDLGEPLTHLVRNAVDHGLESSEIRRRLGKPETGTIFLRASHKGNNICIEVGDDGNGLDPEKIAASAIAKGTITQEHAERMSDRDKMNLIFRPGFSTAPKVTGLSGRGVGMDAVSSMISSVNGVIDIDTEIGGGTTFILKIPLTLAIIQALLVTIGEEAYAFPLEAVTEIIKVSKSEVYSIDGTDTVKLRDQALSLVSLENVIGVKGKIRDDKDIKKVVVITDGDQQLGVIVDSLIGEEDIVIKSLPEHFSDVKGISGASILGDGQIALILDFVSIIKESR
jgi:two-component system chemotaxis sensor kinase CheA